MIGDFGDKTLSGVTMSVCCCCESSLKPSPLCVKDNPSIKGFGGLFKSTLLWSAVLQWRTTLLDFRILPLQVTWLKPLLINLLSLKFVKTCLWAFSVKGFLQVLKVEENTTLPFFPVTCVSNKMDYKSFQSCWIRNTKSYLTSWQDRVAWCSLAMVCGQAIDVSASENSCDLQVGDTMIVVMHSNIKPKRIGKWWWNMAGRFFSYKKIRKE